MEINFIENNEIYNNYTRFIIIHKLFIIFIISSNFIFYSLFISEKKLMREYKIKQPIITSISNKENEEYIMNIFKAPKKNAYNEKCYLSPDNSNIKIIHIISTRFLHEPKLWNKNNEKKNIYNEKYILNGIRVMKKYLLPSLDNQNCKQFIWVLTLGDETNITYITSLLDLNYSFNIIVVHQNNFKNVVRNITKGFEVLISSRIDYDDQIYYDAVNDVRKAINLNKPIFLYGYHRGVYYYEAFNKYYEFYKNYNNQGALGIFISLIVILNKVNDTFIINDLGVHTAVKRNLLKKYKKYGIKEINYEPANFDSGSEKFVYVRQQYSNDYNRSIMIKKNLKEYKFNLNKFYGK